MEWNLKMRGEEVTYTILPDETAVRVIDDSLDTTPTEHAKLFGAPVGEELFEGTDDNGSATDREIFRRAGWQFVHPVPEIAFAAENSSPISNAADVRQVIISETKARLIDTGLATVRLNDDLSEEQSLKVLQEDQLSIVYRLGFAKNTFEVRLPPGRPLPEVINQLQARTDRYLYAEPSLLQVINERSAPQVEPGISAKEQWQHFNDGTNGGVKNMDLGSLAAWQITRGRRKQQVRVAVIDHGMQISHPDLSAGIVGGGFFRSVNLGEAELIPFTPGMTDFPNPDNHGTFCLGLVGARINGVHGCGLAPEAGLIPIACARQKVATQTTLARAIQYAADPKKENNNATPNQAADVISCSLNTRQMLNSNLSDAITFAAKKGRGGKGIPIFWAVSNDHTSTDEDKVFRHPELIGVGPYDRTGEKVESAFGPGLEYLAPGLDVFSTGRFSNFESGDGSSFATPLAAAVAALVLSIQPDWTAEQVREHLRQSCEPPNNSPQASKHDKELGFGRLSARIAVEKAKPADL